MTVHPSRFRFSSAAAVFFIPLFCVLVQAYDYSEPMRCAESQALGYPESPFVLRFSPEELQTQPIWGKRVDAIVIAGNAPSPISIGARTLRDALNKFNLGPAKLVELDPTSGSLPAALVGKRVIVLGVPGSLALVAALAEKADLQVTDAALNGDGFIVKPLKQDGADILLIASPVPRGVLYGAYELEERIGRRGVPRIEQSFVPSVRYRSWGILNFRDEPPGLGGRLRFNISMTYEEDYHHFLLYKEYPELGGEKDRTAIIREQNRLHAKWADAAKHGIMPAFVWNPLSDYLVPRMESRQAHRQALSQTHPDILAKPWDNKFEDILGRDRYYLCPSSPATREFVKSGVRELLQTFPELEVFIFHLSDVGGELLCGCDRCKDYPYFDRFIDYAKLIIKTARDVNPGIRLMLTTHGVTGLFPMLYPELNDDPTIGFKEVMRHLGGDVEAIVVPVSSPPGMDIQPWFSPDSTMLGQGIPLYFWFQYDEPGGPGVVAPISPVMTHLSWHLPVYLARFNKFIRPGQGLVGSMSQQAGVEVAYWHPEMDARKYLWNWCRAKYGREAGAWTAKALADTHKITEGFALDKQPRSGSFAIYRWGPYSKPWLTDMKPFLRTIGLNEPEAKSVEDYATMTYLIPQAPQPEALQKIKPAHRNQWMEKFALAQEIALAERAETMMARALDSEPDNRELQRIARTAKATTALCRFFRSYHLSLIGFNLARNTPDSKGREALWAESGENLKRAIRYAFDYKNNILPIVESDASTQGHLARHVKFVYVACTLSLVREAAYLFDQEFGNAGGLLEYFDGQTRLNGSNAPG